VDSIVDIVGACLGLHLLGIDEIWSSPVAVGMGWIEIAHGRVPLPAPATIELLRGAPIEQRDSGFELTTPTGAALLSTLAKGFGVMPPAKVVSVGYGAGNDRPGPVPNCLRVIILESEGDEEGPPLPQRDTVVVLETNLDDMSPEWLGHLTERLLEEGALDVAIAPILMKKSRPAHALTVIAPPALEARLAAMLFTEGTTFGVRRREVERWVLARESREIDTPWGRVRIKIGRRGDEIVSAAPEHEDLRRAAASSGLSLRELHRRVLEIFYAHDA
ncbi:MAG TPA: LarC family nickel insertion protein, partial [Planctomycetota bacterium]|nr:LarC family nickel insertion protein [Planctomycetota bacterium]